MVYSLENCPYSMKSEKLLEDKKNKKIIKVKYSNKEKYKKKNKMNTFPQIFLNYKNKKIKLGGCDNLENIMNIISKTENLTNILKNIKLKITKKEKLMIIDILK